MIVEFEGHRASGVAVPLCVVLQTQPWAVGKHVSVAVSPINLM